MALVVVADLLKAGRNSGSSGVGVDSGLLTIDLDVAVDLRGLDLGGAGGDALHGGGDLALDGGHHGGVVVILTADAGNDAVELGDGGVHGGGVIGVVLNPLGDLSQSVQGLLRALGDQLGSQLLVGDGADALAGVGADQGVHIRLGGLGGQNSRQGGVQVRLRNLSLVGQGSQTLHRHVGAIDGQGAVGGAGADQDVNHLVGDGQGSAVDLDAHQRLRLDSVDLGLGALGQHLQLVKSGVLRHIHVPLKNICLRLFAENSIENVLHLFISGGIVRTLRIVFRIIGRSPLRLECVVKRLLDLFVGGGVFLDDLQDLRRHIPADVGGRDQLLGVDPIHNPAGQTPDGILLLRPLDPGDADLEIDAAFLQAFGRDDTPVIRKLHRRLLHAAGVEDSRLCVAVPALVKVELHNVDFFGVLHQTVIFQHMGIGCFHCDFHGLHLLTE